MRLKNVVLNLTAEEAQEILRVDLDGDPAGALDLMRSVLAKKVREPLKTH
jgi:sRNA-binding protein